MGCDLYEDYFRHMKPLFNTFDTFLKSDDNLTLKLTIEEARDLKRLLRDYPSDEIIVQEDEELLDDIVKRLDKIIDSQKVSLNEEPLDVSNNNGEIVW